MDHGGDRRERCPQGICRLTHHHGTREPGLAGLSQGFEVRALGPAARNQHQGTGKTPKRRDRRPHIRSLGVIDERDPVFLGNPLTPVFEARKLAQGIQASRRSLRVLAAGHSVGQRQCRQGIGLVVPSRDAQPRSRQYRPGIAEQPPLAPMRHGAVAAVQALPRRKRDARGIVGAHRPHDGIVPVEYRHARRAQQSCLDGRVALQAAVAIEVIGGDVQHRRGVGAEAAGGLQLKAGQFEHVDFRRVSQQIHCGRAEVASGGDAQAGCRQHLLHQGDHGALAVGAGHRDHRCARGTGKQLDLADHGDSTSSCLGRDADIQTQSGRNDHLGYPLQPSQMEALKFDLQIRLCGAQGFQPGRVRPAVDHPHLLAA